MPCAPEVEVMAAGNAEGGHEAPAPLPTVCQAQPWPSAYHCSGVCNTLPWALGKPLTAARVRAAF